MRSATGRRWRSRWNRLLEHRVWGIAVLAGGSALVATLIAPPRPLLVWNASLSSRVGLYRVDDPKGVRAGDMVVAWPPAAIRRWAAERHYLPLNVPLVKPVVAARGDRVCAQGRGISVNGRLLGHRRKADRRGRRLPSWQGCLTLGPGQLFLMSAAVPEAFDGRYFGITDEADLVGRARHFWPLA